MLATYARDHYSSHKSAPNEQFEDREADFSIIIIYLILFN
jgi:hypothetical protein